MKSILLSLTLLAGAAHATAQPSAPDFKAAAESVTKVCVEGRRCVLRADPTDVAFVSPALGRGLGASATLLPRAGAVDLSVLPAGLHEVRIGGKTHVVANMPLHLIGPAGSVSESQLVAFAGQPARHIDIVARIVGRNGAPVRLENGVPAVNLAAFAGAAHRFGERAFVRLGEPHANSPLSNPMLAPAAPGLHLVEVGGTAVKPGTPVLGVVITDLPSIEAWLRSAHQTFAKNPELEISTLMQNDGIAATAACAERTSCAARIEGAEGLRTFTNGTAEVVLFAGVKGDHDEGVVSFSRTAPGVWRAIDYGANEQTMAELNRPATFFERIRLARLRAEILAKGNAEPLSMTQTLELFEGHGFGKAAPIMLGVERVAVFDAGVHAGRAERSDVCLLGADGCFLPNAPASVHVSGALDVSSGELFKGAQPGVSLLAANRRQGGAKHILVAGDREKLNKLVWAEKLPASLANHFRL